MQAMVLKLDWMDVTDGVEWRIREGIRRKGRRDDERILKIELFMDEGKIIIIAFICRNH